MGAASFWKMEKDRSRVEACFDPSIRRNDPKDTADSPTAAQRGSQPNNIEFVKRGLRLPFWAYYCFYEIDIYFSVFAVRFFMGAWAIAVCQ